MSFHSWKQYCNLIMRFLVGDECGLLKEYVPEIAHKKMAKEAENQGKVKPDIILPAHFDVAKINNSYGIQRVDTQETQTRARGVIDMCFVGEETDAQFSYAALRANGSVELWHSKTQENKKKFANHQRLSLSGDVFEKAKKNSNIPKIPVKPLALANIGSKGRLCAADTQGNIVVLKTDNSEDIYEPVSVIQQLQSFQNTEDNINLTYTKGKMINRQLASAMTASSDKLAVGGRERDVTILDLESGKRIWKAKNLPPDSQTLLQQPIWPSAMAFVNPKDSNLLAVGTAFGQLRLYDVRSSPSECVVRRPIRYTPERFVENRITALCQVSEHQVVVADTTGDIHALDLRKNLNGQRGNRQVDGSSSLGRYVGPAGSIRQLVKHHRLPIMAAVGCDRMLRTYNTQTQNAIDCVYLKQRLNCVLVCKEGTTDDFAEDEDGYESMKDDDMGMDQEDVVKDYVDSSDEDDSNSGDDAEADHGSATQDSDNHSHGSYDRVSKTSGDNNTSSEESGLSSEDSGAVSDRVGSDSEAEDNSDEEEQAPRKRRRR